MPVSRCLTLCSVAVFIFCGSQTAFAKEMIIVALGDSTTAGTPGFMSPVEAPPEGSGNPESQYTYWIIRRHPEWRVLNRGVNGERSDEIAQRFARDVAANRPSVVIILAGVNDIYQGGSAEQVIGELKGLYAKATEQGIMVVACTILPYRGIDKSRRAAMTQVNSWISDYSAANKLLFCDLAGVVRDPAAPWQLAGSPDGLHPDVAGYRAMGEALATVLETWQHFLLPSSGV